MRYLYKMVRSGITMGYFEPLQNIKLTLRKVFWVVKINIKVETFLDPPPAPQPPVWLVQPPKEKGRESSDSAFSRDDVRPFCGSACFSPSPIMPPDQNKTAPPSLLMLHTASCPHWSFPIASEDETGRTLFTPKLQADRELLDATCLLAGHGGCIVTESGLPSVCLRWPHSMT